MNTPVRHHAPKAFFIAANAAIYLPLPSFHHFSGPVSIGYELAAHGDAVHAPRFQLFFNEGRVRQPAYSAYRQLREATHSVAEPQKATFLPKVWMVPGRYCVADLSMVGQSHVEAGYSCLLQQWQKHAQFFFQYTGISVVWMF